MRRRNCFELGRGEEIGEIEHVAELRRPSLREDFVEDLRAAVAPSRQDGGGARVLEDVPGFLGAVTGVDGHVDDARAEVAHEGRHDLGARLGEHGHAVAGTYSVRSYSVYISVGHAAYLFEGEGTPAPCQRHASHTPET